MRGALAFAVLFGAAGVASSQDLVVYDDEARNGFDGAFSFGGGTDLGETGTVFAGTASIAYTGSDEFNAVSFARAFVPDLPASQYHTLRFYVHGGATGGQRLRLYVARDSETESVTVATGLIDPYVVGGGGIVANEWKLVSVPLADFGVDGPYDRFDLQTELGAQPVLYLDEIVLVGTAALETATVVVPLGATSVDVPVRFFGDGIVAGFDFGLTFTRGAPIATSGTVDATAGTLENGSVSCGGSATTDPAGTALSSIAFSPSSVALGSGLACTFRFPLDPSAPAGTYPFTVDPSSSNFVDSLGETVAGTFFGGGLVLAEGSAPSLSYTPPPPSQIDLPGGALGTPVQATINVQSLGGSGVGRVRLECATQGAFSLPDGGTFSVGAGAEPLELAIGCTPGAADELGQLDCTETDEPALDAPRLRSWPLRCPAGSSAGFSADSATANRGGPVGIGIRFIGDGVVHSAVGDLVFDPARLTPTQVSPANGANCFLRPAPNEDRIAVVVPSGPQPLAAAETTYCNVVFVLADNAPIDATPLTFVATSCEDVANADVGCAANDGSVTTSAFDSSPRPGSALSLVAAAGQSSVSGTITAINFGATAIDVAACTPEPADGFSVTPPGAFSIAGFDFDPITIGCTPPAPGLPPRVSDLSCVLQDTDPARVVRYRVLCSNGASQGPLPGGSLSDAGSGAGDEIGTALATTLLPSGEEIMVVGAPFGGADNSGRAFVLVRAAGAPPAGALAKRAGALGAWDDAFAIGTAHVLSGASAIGDKFGNAVAIDAAGETIAIGAPGAGAGGTGRVFVFTRPLGGWGSLDTPDYVIEAPVGGDAGDTVADDFGAELSFTANGMLVVGAPLADVGAGAADAGAAYAYAAGSIVPAEILRSPQVETGAGFGGAIASDGDAIAISAPLENAGGNSDQGAVYVMTAPGAPAEPTRRVTATAGAIGDKFGQSVAMANGVLVVGAPADNTATGTDAGSATVYSGDPGSGFTERMTLAPAGDATQQAGASVATNGDVILLGAPFAPVAGRPAQGRVFAYDVPENFASAAPPVATIIDSPAGQVGDRFGARLATSARRLLVGVPKDDNELGLGGTTVQVDEGRADPFLLDRIFRGGYE